MEAYNVSVGIGIGARGAWSTASLPPSSSVKKQQQYQGCRLAGFSSLPRLSFRPTTPPPPPPPPLCYSRYSIKPKSLTPRHIHMHSDLMSQLELEKSEPLKEGRKSVNGIYWILLLNIGVYVADYLIKFYPIKGLYLYHSFPRWYQFITATFCHANWAHLSSNLFFLYIFGKLVEEEEGSFALWISYLVTGAGANLVSWLILPRSVVSVGASGAVFGLFAISVLVKISWDWRRILEVIILGQFVIDKVMEAAQASVEFVGNSRNAFAVQNVNHLAHLSGALIGVVLIWLISQIPTSEKKKHSQKLKPGTKK